LIDTNCEDNVSATATGMEHSEVHALRRDVDLDWWKWGSHIDQPQLSPHGGLPLPIGSVWNRSIGLA
jgi:hypothetical protein